MSDTVIPIASTLSTGAERCWASASSVGTWSTARTSDSSQTAKTLWRRRRSWKSCFIDRPLLGCATVQRLPAGVSPRPRRQGCLRHNRRTPALRLISYRSQGGLSIPGRPHFARHSQALQQVITHAQRIGHDGQRGVNGGARWEEARIHYVQVVEIVCLAISIERRSPGIVPEANGAVLMGYAGKRNFLSHVQISCEQTLVALVTMHRAIGLLHRLLEFGLEPIVRLKVIRRVRQNDLAVAIHRNAIVRVGKIF